MRKALIWIGILSLLVLVACGAGSSSGNGATTAVTTTQNSPAGAAVQALGTGELSTQAKLALGVLQLETTADAVTAEQGNTMLPYWRTLQALIESGTAADVEIEAVLKPIQNALTAAQLDAINSMDISADTIQSVLAQTAETNRAGGAGRGFDGGFPGGGPPPGGGLGPEGFPGGGIDPDQLATRQAERGGALGAGAMQDRILVNSAVRLLENKTGDVTIVVNMFDAMSVVSEATGLTPEALRDRLVEGKTLAEIVTESGGDLDAVRATLADVFANATLEEGQTLETAIETILNGTLPARPDAP